YLPVVEDEDAANIKLQALVRIAPEEIQRPMLGDVEKRLEFDTPLGRVVDDVGRVFEVVRHMLVELMVLLGGDFRLGPKPDRLSRIERLVLLVLFRSFTWNFQKDWMLDKIGILVHKFANLPFFQELLI